MTHESPPSVDCYEKVTIEMDPYRGEHLAEYSLQSVNPKRFGKRFVHAAKRHGFLFKGDVNGCFDR